MSVLCSVPLSTAGLTCPADLGVQASCCIVSCLSLSLGVYAPPLHIIPHLWIPSSNYHSSAGKGAELANEPQNEGLPQGASQQI